MDEKLDYILEQLENLQCVPQQPLDINSRLFKMETETEISSHDKGVTKDLDESVTFFNREVSTIKEKMKEMTQMSDVRTYVEKSL